MLLRRVGKITTGLAISLLLLGAGIGYWLVVENRRHSQETDDLIREVKIQGPCGVERVRTSLKLIGDKKQRWDEANLLASSAPRISLPIPITNLQQIRHEVKALDIAPCLTLARHYLLEEMEAVILSYIAFMGSNDSEVLASHLIAEEAKEKREEAILAVRQRVPDSP